MTVILPNVTVEHTDYGTKVILGDALLISANDEMAMERATRVIATQERYYREGSFLFDWMVQEARLRDLPRHWKSDLWDIDLDLVLLHQAMGTRLALWNLYRSGTNLMFTLDHAAMIHRAHERHEGGDFWYVLDFPGARLYAPASYEQAIELWHQLRAAVEVS